MTKEEIIENFDPNQPGLADASLFGLPFPPEISDVIIVPAPWEVTVSYGSGASDAANAVFDASFQVDLVRQEVAEVWKLGSYMDEESHDWKTERDKYKKVASPMIEAVEKGENPDEYTELKSNLGKINSAGTQFKNELKERISLWLNQGKLVGLLGGDHSTPLGYFEAQAERHEENRKSTRLNSSHVKISYAVFCLKKKIDK